VESLSTRQECNAVRYRPGDGQGHYESYFQRANHPSRPLAFWIRYTIFSPRSQPNAAVGELWAVYFDGETGKITAARDVFPIDRCQFSSDSLDVNIADATLSDGVLAGSASGPDGCVAWDLRFEGGQEPLLLLPRKFYSGGFPKAKSLVGTPNAHYGGRLLVGDRKVDVRNWVGSQNHNWGKRHTDHYAWGQVAGFDNDSDAFLELSTARVRVGPLWTPFFTLVVLRVGGYTYAFNGLWRALLARGHFNNFHWAFSTADANASIEGHIEATSEDFVALRYDNPPGGYKTCLNSKLAFCQLTLRRAGVEPLTLHTQSRAAFEILTDNEN
jgi:hypothetical protein